MFSTMNQLMWSDKFFNGDWTPAVNFQMSKEEIEKVCLESAREFKRLFPECPFDEKWLMDDFLRRL